jgi:acyl-CoA reductase-like NAD-dependent aldehyde dehydrogenase
MANFDISFVYPRMRSQVSLPDCETNMAAHDIVASFSGCCGQRCMAAAVLLTVGEQAELVSKIVEKAGALKPGTVSDLLLFTRTLVV